VWPSETADLIALQEHLRTESGPRLVFDPGAGIGACFVCFGRQAAGTGAAGDAGWAAAAVTRHGHQMSGVAVTGTAAGPYHPGLLAMREGALLCLAVTALPSLPQVLLVDATGRDHPRRSGLAVHLGAAIGVPTVGVTHRPLLAQGAWPADIAGAWSPLLLDGNEVGRWLRTRAGARPLAVHAAWGTDPDLAVEVVMATTSGARTPEPLRTARRIARRARAAES
jgi:deoxyribonuclease V